MSRIANIAGAGMGTGQSMGDGLGGSPPLVPQMQKQPVCSFRTKCIVGFMAAVILSAVVTYFILKDQCKNVTYNTHVFKKLCHALDLPFNATNDQKVMLTINPSLNPCELKGLGCHNGGTCSLAAHKHVKCQCTEAFTGNQCEVALTTVTELPTIIPCSMANPCQNGGTCQQSGNRLTCICTQDYVGHLCDKAAPTMETFAPYDPCRVMPCSNGGSCVRDGQSYICECPVGIVGDRCEEQEEPSVGGGNNGRSSKKSWVVILIALTVIGIIVVVYLTCVKGKKKKQPKKDATRSVQPPSRVVQRPTY